MFRRSPSLKILTIALIGFILPKFFSFSLFGLISFSIYSFVIFLIITLIFKNKFPVFFYFAFVFGLFTSLRTQHLDYNPRTKCNNQNNAYIYGNVAKVLKSSPKYTRLIVEGKVLNDKWELIKNTRFLLTVINSRKIQYDKIHNNDIIAGQVKYKLPTPANLANEFNELNYLRNLDCEFSAIGFANKISIINIYHALTFREIAKKSLYHNIDKMYSRSTRGIVKAILLGDKTELHRSTRQNFAIAGVAHILAVSGFHVGIIAAILYWLFAFISNHYAKFLLISISLFAYIYIVDFQPSAVRAGIMIILLLFAFLVQRKPNPVNIIATTVLLVALVHPSSLYSIGFQMSVAAISGIILLYKPFKLFLDNYFKFDKKPILQKVSNSISISLAASVIVSPLVAFYFGIFSVISPLANLIVIPLMMFGQIFGIVSLVSSYIYTPIGQIFANASQLSIELATYLAHYAAQLPFAYISGESVTIFSILISAVLTYLFLSKNHRILLFRFIVIAFFLFIFLIRQYTFSQPKIKVYERPNSFFIENTIKNISILIGKKDCQNNWDDYGLINYLKNNKSKLLIYNIPNQMKYSLWKNKIKYKRISTLQELNKHIQ